MKHRSLFQLYIIPWLVLLGGCLLGKLAGENAENYGAWLLMASALFFGLPHGAYDFWILTDAASRENKRASAILKLLFGYLFISVLIVVVWFFLPDFALISFLFLSVWHFGSGDAVWESEGKFGWILSSIGRGSVLIFAPSVFFPSESGTVLSNLISNQNTQIVGFLLGSAPYVFVFGILLILLGSAELKTEKSRLILLETILLIIFFWLTSPLLAVTIYLIGVHSWRHLLRLDIYENANNANKYNNLFNLVCRFHYRSLPVTIFSILGIGLIFWLWKFRVSDLAGYTSAYLVLLSALTVPHAILITWTECRHQKTNPLVY
jgi:beta-carotene 15,15'-dioxygenase